MVDLIDVVLEGFKSIIDWMIGLFLDGITSGYETITEQMFGTPLPQTDGSFVFGTPTNNPWSELHTALVGGEVMFLSLTLLVICVQGRHLSRIFNIGSAYESRKTRKSAWLGAFLIISWYWISVLLLYLVDGFTIALLPSLDTLGRVMIGFLQDSIINPSLSMFFVSLGSLSMWSLLAIYYIRDVLLYVYIYGMPLLFAIGYGNIPILSDIAIGFSKRFVPLAILPLPASVIFKGYDLLYVELSLEPSTAFLQYIVAVSLPLLALYATWKTFIYASPTTTKVLGRTAKGAAMVAGTAAGGYVGGTGLASNVAKVGTKKAAQQMIIEKVASKRSSSGNTGSTPSYRRTQNED